MYETQHVFGTIADKYGQKKIPLKPSIFFLHNLTDIYSPIFPEFQTFLFSPTKESHTMKKTKTKHFFKIKKELPCLVKYNLSQIHCSAALCIIWDLFCSQTLWDYFRPMKWRGSPLHCVKGCLGTWTRVAGSTTSGHRAPAEWEFMLIFMLG